jgi:hypothetical protein
MLPEQYSPEFLVSVMMINDFHYPTNIDDSIKMVGVGYVHQDEHIVSIGGVVRSVYVKAAQFPRNAFVERRAACSLRRLAKQAEKSGVGDATGIRIDIQVCRS